MIPASSTIYPSVGAGVCKISISDAFAASTQDVKDIADANASADAPKPSRSSSTVPGLRFVSFSASSSSKNDDDVDDDDDGDEGSRALHFVRFVARVLCCFQTRLTPILLDDATNATLVMVLLMDVVIVLSLSLSLSPRRHKV